MTHSTNEPDWSAVRNAYEVGGVRLIDIAEQMGLSYGALRNRASRHRWVRSASAPSEPHYEIKPVTDLQARVEILDMMHIFMKGVGSAALDARLRDASQNEAAYLRTVIAAVREGLQPPQREPHPAAIESEITGLLLDCLECLRFSVDPRKRICAAREEIALKSRLQPAAA